jgi:hypothetical protein
VLRARVADLSDDELVTRSKLAVEDVRAVVSAYERALDRCERTLTGVRRLDLDSRRVRIAQRQAEIMVQAVEAALAAVGVDGHAPAFRKAFAEELRRAPV